MCQSDKLNRQLPSTVKNASNVHKTIKVLVQAGADVNASFMVRRHLCCRCSAAYLQSACSRRGGNILHHVLRIPDFIPFLIKAGADIHSKTTVSSAAMPLETIVLCFSQTAP